MKILFITTWYPNEDNPVEGIFVKEHAKAISMYGDEVTLVYCRRNKIRSKRIYQINESYEEGIRVVRIYYSPLPIRSINYLIFIFSILKTCSNLIQKGFRPDIIHANVYTAGVPAMILGKYYKIPMVLSEHWSGYATRKLGIIQKAQIKIALRQASFILPVSKTLMKCIESYGIKNKFQIVPNIVDLNIFYPSLNNRKERKETKILFVGLLSPIKGIDYLLQAAYLLLQSRDDWCLDIIGDGPFRAKYERMAKELKLNAKVTFNGLKSKQEIAEWMRQGDILVLPSIWENSPCVLIEGMACGMPIVSTCVGGIPEIVDKEVGTLVPPKNPKILANAISKMIDTLPKYDKINIAKKAEGYSPEAIGRLIHSVYEKCIRNQ